MLGSLQGAGTRLLARAMQATEYTVETGERVELFAKKKKKKTMAKS